MTQRVKIVYGEGGSDALARSAAALIDMRMAFYYSKGFLRVKARRPERVRMVRDEFLAQNLRVHVRVDE